MIYINVLVAAAPVKPSNLPNSEKSSITTMPSTVASTTINATIRDPGIFYSYICAVKT